jgi:hypothetical protein
MASDRHRAIRRSDAGSPLAPRGGSARVRLLIVLAVIGGLLFAVAAHGRLIRKGRSPIRSVSGNPTRSSGDVRLGGHAAGLYPGRVEYFWVHVDNFGGQPRVLRSVRTAVGDARPRCSALNVSVSAYRGRLRLPPHRRRWIALTIAMRSDAANACRHAVFPLAFRADVGR